MHYSDNYYTHAKIAAQNKLHDDMVHNGHTPKAGFPYGVGSAVNGDNIVAYCTECGRMGYRSYTQSNHFGGPSYRMPCGSGR